MAKHHRKRRQRDKVRPAQARPLDPEAFQQAVLRAQEAASRPPPLAHEWLSPSVRLQGQDEELALSLNDAPFMRAMLTLRECFPQPEDSFSAFRRCQALENLLEDQALSPWVKPVGSAWQVNDAVLFVAATAPLDAKGHFVLEPFCEALARWAQEHPEPPQADEPVGA